MIIGNEWKKIKRERTIFREIGGGAVTNGTNRRAEKP
jgi:hypothetical protein